MDKKSFTRGSEWRKWDLHFHTPSSYDYRDKNVTNQEIIDILAENGISVVAITDHHTMDIARIQELQLLGKDKGITVLPGIEFLADARGKEPIHFIGIFSDTSNISYIWGQLKNTTNIKQIEGSNKKHNEVYCDLIDTMKLIKELGGITTIHAGSKTNNIENITNSLPHTIAQKEDIVDLVDIYELGKVTDKEGYIKNVFPNIGKYIPMIIASDNHDIKNYSLKENCWIKADPTFEGLKQIIYEPEERVRIQENKPEEKSGYQVIDRIEIYHQDFQEKREEKENEETIEKKEEFKTIFLNPNLNTIIGGRSTGKSILLGAIAKKLNSDKEVKLDNTEYSKYIDDIVSNMRIFWKDEGENSKRDIEYFPQSYMYQLARNSDELNKLVENIITQDINKKTKIEAYQAFSSDNNSEIIEDINKLFKTKASIDNIQKSMTEIGDEEGIIKEKGKLSKDLEDLKTKIQITEEQWSSYSNLKDEYDKNNRSIQEIERQKISLSALKSISIINDITHNLINLTEDIRKKVNTIFSGLKQRYYEEWNGQIQTILLEKEAEIQKIKERNESIEKDESYLKGKSVIDSNQQYKEKEEKYKIENGKLEEITELKKQKAEYEKHINSLKNSIIENSKKYCIELQQMQSELSVSSGKLKITATINTDFSKYKDILYSSINQQGSQKKEIIEKSIKTTQELFDDMSNMFELLLSDSITLKGGYDNQKLIKELLGTNFFNISYEIEYDTDKFKAMSEGKKAFIILMLLLDFSNKQCPILIDQPEDDLDNRAIYNELVTYIKNKKKERQIIIVTHNSNIVIGADSELVIVSNQQGVNSPNRNNKKFDYIFGSIESSMEKDNDIREILYSQGIRQHICEILEGGKEAFKNRERKYGF